MQQQEPKNSELLAAINRFDVRFEDVEADIKMIIEASKKSAADNDAHFRKIEDKFDAEFSSMKGDISGMKGEISGMKGEISGMKGDIAEIKSTMVTKDYLDVKMADLRGDLITVIRKGDAKVDALTGTLRGRDLLTSQELAHINAQGPFPRP